MPQHPIEPALKESLAAIRHARDVRKYHARRTGKGSQQRENDLREALERLRRAMIPLRAFRGAAPYKPQTHAHVELADRVAEASKVIQGERRRLWKMQDRKQARLAKEAKTV